MASGAAAASPFLPDERFAQPAGEDALRRAAAAPTAKGFTVEILDDAGAARAHVRDLLPGGAAVFTSSSETLRLSGIEDDLNASGRYRAVKPRIRSMDRATQLDEIRVLISAPDVVVGSVAAVTETCSQVAASATCSEIPVYGGGAAMRVWIAGAQKVVPDLDAALRRLEAYALPLEDARARAVYGQPTAANEVLIVSGDHVPGRSIVLLLRQPIGY